MFVIHNEGNPMKLHSALIVLSLIAPAAFASDQTANSKTRDQVRAELLQAAVQSGDMLASGESGLTLKQLNPGAYPLTSPAAGAKTRAQVQAELVQAIQSGDLIAVGESGARMSELQPARYPGVAAGPTKTREQVQRELAQAMAEGEVVAVGEDGRTLHEMYPERYHAAHPGAVAASSHASPPSASF